MNIKKVKISQLKEWEKNPRSIKDKDINRLIKQIKMLGVYKPLIVCEDKKKGQYIVLGGNIRLRALKKLNYEEVEVSIVEAKTDKQKLQYNLSDNDRVGFYIKDEVVDIINNIEDFDIEDFAIDIEESIDLNTILKDEEKENFPIEGKNITELYNILVECKDEKEQKECFDLLKKRGYKCRLLIL